MNTEKFYAEQIANEYTPKQTSDIKALKRLDKKVKNPPLIFAYTFGIIFALILGVGMCLCMQVIGPKTITFFVVGIIIGCVGILGVSVNYFIYKKILNERKSKYAQDIINLAKKITDK